ncbi:MAG: hypothetical protein KAG56_09510 [Sulfurovaceae bacterium]|nr:hypothetical protein [Sulfurovaceae bacterium]
METIGIRDLQINPAILTKSLENREFVMITKRGSPLGVATAFNDVIFQRGLGDSLVLKAFEQGDISFSQLSKSLNLTKSKTMKLLAIMDIPLTDYSIKEDLQGIQSFLK